MISAFKRGQKVEKLSLLTAILPWIKIFALSKRPKKSRKSYLFVNDIKKSLLAGKLSLEKNVCGFEWCLVLSQKFGGKILHCSRFLPSKVKVYV